MAAQAAAAPVKKRHHKGRIITVVAVGIILVVGIVLVVSHGSGASSSGSSSGSASGGNSVQALPNQQVCPIAGDDAVAYIIKCGNLDSPAYLGSILSAIEPDHATRIPVSNFNLQFSTAYEVGTLDVVQLFGSDQTPAIIAALQQYNNGGNQS